MRPLVASSACAGAPAELPHLSSSVLYVSLVRSGKTSTEYVAPDSGFETKQGEENNKNPSSFCPVCSARLEAHKCKLRCPTCGYYMSCSDYY